MFKLQTLDLINKFMHDNEESIIFENEIDTEFQTDTQLLVKTKRLEDVEHDLFAFIASLDVSDTESSMARSTMISHIRFTPVFNGILIYIAE